MEFFNSLLDALEVQISQISEVTARREASLRKQQVENQLDFQRDGLKEMIKNQLKQFYSVLQQAETNYLEQVALYVSEVVAERASSQSEFLQQQLAEVQLKSSEAQHELKEQLEDLQALSGQLQNIKGQLLA
ncbi:MAG: hypothetical protein AB1538_04000 [Bacillota bacterium]